MAHECSRYMRLMHYAEIWGCLLKRNEFIEFSRVLVGPAF